VQPVYPFIAKQNRIQGIVIIESIIGTDGTVEDAKVIRSIPLLDQAALEAVKAWEYTPTLLNGRPTPVIMTVTVHFKLSD
jgi:protein TonB